MGYKAILSNRLYSLTSTLNCLDANKQPYPANRATLDLSRKIEGGSARRVKHLNPHSPGKLTLKRTAE